jgi:hypothetical protein
MAEGFGINSAASGVQSNLSAVSSASQAADAAASLPQTPKTDTTKPQGSTQGVTTYAPDPPAAGVEVSKVVNRLLEQGATIYGPGLARLPLPARPDGAPRTQPKKPAGPMGAPRTLDGGNSPLATTSLFDARASADTLGLVPDLGHDVSADWSGRLDALESYLESSS